MAASVYILCAATSFACAVLLLRGYARGKVRLLFWSGLGFVGFTLGNVFLVLNTLVVPTMDLFLLRSLPILAGLIVLIYGLIWDTQ